MKVSVKYEVYVTRWIVNWYERSFKYDELDQFGYFSSILQKTIAKLFLFL